MPNIFIGEFCRFHAPGRVSGDAARNGRRLNSKVLNMNGKKIASEIPEEAVPSGKKNKPVVFLFFSVLALGFSYLYQVNSLATLSFEVRSIEKKIGELEKESKKMQIREVELRSMYNIEKSLEELGLVASQDITYLEMDDGSFAMK